MTASIYLDHQATTPADPRVVEAMSPWWTERFGHPASPHHAYGWDAEKAVDDARASVASLLGADAREIVFTSGGAESDNLACKGVAYALRSKGTHLVTTQVESGPIHDASTWLETQGFEVTRVRVDEHARVDPADIEASIRDDTILVSVQWANHEVGTVQRVAEIGAVCAERDVLFHSDASQAAAWESIDVEAAGVHLLSLTAHRMYGPKGVGALYVRRRNPRVRLVPLVHGGGHERGMRGGTVNVPGVVGLGRAADLVREEHEAEATRVGALRDQLEQALTSGAEGVTILGDTGSRLPHATALTVDGVEGESLVLGASRVALSTGSACSSQTLESSRVLQAMGLTRQQADTSIRLALGRLTTEDEIGEAAEAILEAIARVRVSGRGSS